jgi:hypothetical protein
MPTYTFIDTKTGVETDHIMSFKDLDQFKLDNPDLKQKLIFPGTVGALSTDSGKLPEGFKDNLREMAKKHPHANGIKHLI